MPAFGSLQCNRKIRQGHSYYGVGKVGRASKGTQEGQRKVRGGRSPLSWWVDLPGSSPTETKQPPGWSEEMRYGLSASYTSEC